MSLSNRHAAGAGTDAYTWTLNIPRDGTYQVAVKYPEDTGATTSANYTLTHAEGTAEKTVDQTGLLHDRVTSALACPDL